MLKVSLGSLKQSAYYIHFYYMLEQLKHDEKQAKKTNVHLEMRNLKQAELQSLKNIGKKG